MNHELVLIDGITIHISGAKTITKKRINEKGLLPMENEVVAVEIDSLSQEFTKLQGIMDAYTVSVKFSSGDWGSAVLRLEDLPLLIKQATNLYKEDKHTWFAVEGYHVIKGDKGRIVLVRTNELNAILIDEKREAAKAKRLDKVELEVGMPYLYGGEHLVYVAPAYSERVVGYDIRKATKVHVFTSFKGRDLVVLTPAQIKGKLEHSTAKAKVDKATNIYNLLKENTPEAYKYFHNGYLTASSSYGINTSKFKQIAALSGMPKTKSEYMPRQADQLLSLIDRNWFNNPTSFVAFLKYFEEARRELDV